MPLAPSDFAEAILFQLRTGNAGACAVAFGDTWDDDTQAGTPKFFFDYAATEDDPYAVLFEPGETYQQMTGSPGYIPEIVTGRLECAVYSADRRQARQFGDLVAATLNDAPIAWPAEQAMFLRRTGARFQTVPTTGPRIPAVFCRVVSFEYQYSRQMP